MPKFARINCCKESLMSSNECNFAWCPECFNKYQQVWDGEKTNMRRKRKWGGNGECAATISRKVEPWRKYGAHTEESMKDM